MPETIKGVPLCLGDRVYTVRPDFNTVREIEDELGSLSALHDSFSCNQWKVSELVTLIHMLLQAAGKTVDFVSLGNTMIGEGLDRYLTAARSFLHLALHSDRI